LSIELNVSKGGEGCLPGSPAEGDTKIEEGRERQHNNVTLKDREGRE